MTAVYSNNDCVICRVALGINRTAKGNEWLILLNGSKGFETGLEFCDLLGESEWSKYLLLILFIYVLILVLIVFIYCPHMLTPRQVRESGAEAPS